MVMTWSQGHMMSSVTWLFDSHRLSPIGGPLKRVDSLSPVGFEILASKHIGVTSRVWPFGVTWHHQSRDYLVSHRPFSTVGPLVWNHGSISNGFRYIQWRMWLNGSRDHKRPVNKSQGQAFSTLGRLFDQRVLYANRLSRQSAPVEISPAVGWWWMKSETSFSKFGNVITLS